MGSLCSKSTTTQVIECIHQIQDVELTLQRLIDKYEVQIRTEQRIVRQKIHRKPDCIRHMRTIQIIRHHKKNMEKRLTACMDKRYQLESLNVTKMHIKAVKTTTKTYRQFLNENDIEKVEQLQDTLSEMIEDACEINQVINETPSMFEVDEDEVQREYDSICAELQLPKAPTTTPPELQLELKVPELELVPLTN
jgi:hypothetical protein